ncbi:MAG TPA: alpha/beta hydrolase [Naasia sp.]|jgi:pimeloyl-ACP methyl ester carboxylesterase
MDISCIESDGARIAVETTGAGPLVVCVPGMGDLRSSYRFLTPQLVAAGYRVATFDLRGHGDSSDDFSSFDDEAAARDILAVVDALGGGPAIVVGTSMGAGAAVIAAARRPEAVAGMALLGAFVRNPTTNPAAAAALRLALLPPWGRMVWRAYFRSLFPGRKPDDFAEQEARMTAEFRRGSHWRSFRRTAQTTHAPAEAALPAVTAPALVVMGTKDPDWKDPSAEGRWIADRLGAQLLLVDGAGHYPATEEPDTVGPAVVAFARQVVPVA